MTTAAYLLPQFDSEMASTRRLLACVPEAKLDWMPHPKSMSLARLAGHITDLPNFLAVMITTDEMDLASARPQPFLPATQAELLRQFDKNAARTRKLIADASEEHMGQPWRLTFKDAEVFSGPRHQLLPMTLGHLIHHRGQLTVYLRLNDVQFPGVYGPSADEMGKFS